MILWHEGHYQNIFRPVWSTRICRIWYSFVTSLHLCYRAERNIKLVYARGAQAAFFTFPSNCKWCGIEFDFLYHASSFRVMKMFAIPSVTMEERPWGWPFFYLNQHFRVARIRISQIRTFVRVRMLIGKVIYVDFMYVVWLKCILFIWQVNVLEIILLTYWCRVSIWMWFIPTTTEQYK